MRIIIDAMGGDNAPHEIIKGVMNAAQKTKDDFILVGNREKILRCLENTPKSQNKIDIVDAGQVITMDDEPLTAIRSKPDSSMIVGLKLLADGKGDALVSAGNTGALFSGATLLVKRAPGIRRAAIGTLLPGVKPCLLLDAGANVTVTEEYLEQFAIIGSDYMHRLFDIAHPRVGLLNNGTEDCKGTPLQINAGKLLRENKDINFIGNVEASAVMTGACDVLVCDGFTGNVLLKALEGMGKQMLSAMKEVYTATPMTKLSYLLARSRIHSLKKRFDSSEYGGSPFLGISRPVIKAHGSSDAAAIENAVFQAIKYAKSQMNTGSLPSDIPLAVPN